MARKLDFGWRVPDFGEDQVGDQRKRAITFRDQIFNFMDVVHGHFDTAWAGDHFFPLMRLAIKSNVMPTWVQSLHAQVRRLS